MYITTIAMILPLLLLLFFTAAFGVLLVWGIRALNKYLRSGPVREEKAELKRSLGEVLKEHRTRCKMTQEFVAEALGVTRQAVSKWKSGPFQTPAPLICWPWPGSTGSRRRSFCRQTARAEEEP